MRKAPAGLLAQVPAEHGFSAAEVILSAGMFMASGRLMRDSERAKEACLPWIGTENALASGIRLAT